MSAPKAENTGRAGFKLGSGSEGLCTAYCPQLQKRKSASQDAGCGRAILWLTRLSEEPSMYESPQTSSVGTNATEDALRGASPASGGREPALAAERGIRTCLRATPAERPELCRFALRLLMRLLPVCVPPESCGLGRPPCTRARVLPVWESPTSQEPRGPQPQTGCAHGAPGLHRALLPCTLGTRLGEQTGHLQVGTGCPQASRSMWKKHAVQPGELRLRPGRVK